MYKKEALVPYNEMSVTKIKISQGNLIKEDVRFDDWMFINDSGNFLNQWEVIIPQNSEFIYNKKSIDYINSLGRNLLFDFISSDYPIAVENFDYLLKIFHNKNIRVVSPNLLLYSKNKHYFYDPKIRQMDFVFKYTNVFDELCLNQSKFLRPFKYLYLTSHPRYERIQILEFLNENNLVKEGQVGFPSLEKITEDEFNLCLSQNTHEQKNHVRSIKDKNLNLPIIADFVRDLDYQVNKKHKLWKNGSWVESNLSTGDFNVNLYMNSYVEIFSETYYYGFGSVDEFTSNKNDQYIQVSEKTIKPIINLMPMYCLTERGYYKKLKEMGLTFNSEIYKYLDFDDLNSDNKKVEKFNNSIYKLVSHTKSELHGMYYNSFQELIENKYRFKKVLENQLNECFK